MSINVEVNKTTRQALVCKIEKVEPHPNADRLELLTIHSFTVVSQKGLYTEGDLVVHIQPDSIIDTSRQEFVGFADPNKPGDELRVKAVKLRGIYSMGLVVPAPEGMQEGEDAASVLGVKHYQPGESSDKSYGVDKKQISDIARVVYAKKGWSEDLELTDEQKNELNKSIQAELNRRLAESTPPGFFPKSDAENIRGKYKNVLQEGERCIITEKIHGQSTKFCYDNDKFYVGSRNRWKIESHLCDFWRSFYNDRDTFEKFLVDNPHLALYGEGYGLVKGFDYGVDKKNERCKFLTYDIFDRTKGKYLDVQEYLDLVDEYKLPTVPIIKTNHPFSFAEIEKWSEGQSLLSNHIREGVVIKPMIEKWDEKLGRVILKCVSNEYLNKN